MEIVELRDHPWFVASQFHPEFKSRPERPHPLFDGFVGAAIAVRDGREPVFAAREAPVAKDQVLGEPLASDYLAEGLNVLGYSCQAFET